MIAKMKVTLTNMNGEEFLEGEIVEVESCWINNLVNRIYIKILLNDCEMITSAENIEYVL